MDVYRLCLVLQFSSIKVGLSRNTAQHLCAGVALFLEESCHVYLFLDNPFKYSCIYSTPVNFVFSLHKFYNLPLFFSEVFFFLLCRSATIKDNV